MLRATDVIAKGDWNAMPSECVVLGFEQRHHNAISFTTVSGKGIRLDLAEPVVLRSGDALRLEGGELVEIIGQPEPLAEIRAVSVDELARIAWYLGNRYVQCQMTGGAIRLRRDPMIEAVARALGGTLRIIEAAFDPEGANYVRPGRQKSGDQKSAGEGSEHVHNAHCGCGHDHHQHTHGADGHDHSRHGHPDHGHEAHHHKA